MLIQKIVIFFLFLIQTHIVGVYCGGSNESGGFNKQPQFLCSCKSILSFSLYKIEFIGVFMSCTFTVIASIMSFHYENTPIQIYRKFHHQKLEVFRQKILIFFIFLVKNIDCGYSFEPPHRGGSNEYLQSMFLTRNMKNNVYPCKP